MNARQDYAFYIFLLLPSLTSPTAQTFLFWFYFILFFLPLMVEKKKIFNFGKSRIGLHRNLLVAKDNQFYSRNSSLCGKHDKCITRPGAKCHENQSTVLVVSALHPFWRETFFFSSSFSCSVCRCNVNKANKRSFSVSTVKALIWLSDSSNWKKTLREN